jgi:large subunit ribosomal protein L15
MRLPKFGFSSRKNNYLKEVNVKNIDGLDLVTIETLKEKKIISKSVKKVKIFGTFDLTSKINVKGIKVTSGAKESIEKAGGTVDDIVVPTARPKGIKKTEGASE